MALENARKGRGRGRGMRNGVILSAVGAITESPADITPAWLVTELGITRQQADNAICYARLKGLIRRIARGVYRLHPTPRAA